MPFQNLQIKRVIMHEIFKRSSDKKLIPPTYAVDLEKLNADALNAFKSRMTQVLSKNSKSLTLDIAQSGKDSFVQIANDLLLSTDPDYIIKSKKAANKLAEAQLSIGIPGGIVIIFQGTTGTISNPFIGVIKAETQAGFRRNKIDGSNSIEFLKNIFLTPATRLYKIGAMVNVDSTGKLIEDWNAYVFDNNITSGKKEAAANYFYEGFLGCSFPSDGPYETKRFFDLTKKFISVSNLDADKKKNLVDSLFVFTRDVQMPTFTTDDFGKNYLPNDLRDPYLKYMGTNKFRSTSIVRDISEMGKRLLRRRLRFGSEITLSVTPEALANKKVMMNAVTGPNSEGTIVDKTLITIESPLTGEE